MMYRFAVIVACSVMTGASAYAAPLLSAKLPLKALVVSPQEIGFMRSAPTLPVGLTVKEAPENMSPKTTSYFSFREDETIALHGRDGCIEAEGAADGAPVRINYCSANPNQKWTWRSEGHGRGKIQLKDTTRCLEVADNGNGLRGVPLELKECQNTPAETWFFEDPAATLIGVPALRHVLISLLAMSGVVALSLRAWFWRKHRGAGQIATNISGISLPEVLVDQEQGTSNTSPFVKPERNHFSFSAFRHHPVSMRAAVAESPKIADVGVQRSELEAATRPMLFHPAVRVGRPLVIGLSHKTATVDVREKLAVKEADWNKVAAQLCRSEAVQEAAVISTCNRFELYLSTTDHASAINDVLAFLSDRCQYSREDLEPFLFKYENDECVMHLMSVAGGLDSLVLGEAQIMHQVKLMLDHATREDEYAEDGVTIKHGGSAGRVLGQLMRKALTAGKRVRTETCLGQGGVSVSSVAVHLAMKKSPLRLGKPLSETRVTIIGAGKMSKLLLQHLACGHNAERANVTKVTLVNRRTETAQALVDDVRVQIPELDVDVVPFSELRSVLEQSDVVFASTAAREPIVTKQHLEQRAQDNGGKPVITIDISVPLNVEPECSEVDGVSAYTVDDLNQVMEDTQKKRHEAAAQAEEIVRDEKRQFIVWQNSIEYVPAIIDVQAYFEGVRNDSLALAKQDLDGLSEKEWNQVEAATKSIAKSLMREPIGYLKSEDFMVNGLKGKKMSCAELRGLLKLHAQLGAADIHTHDASSWMTGSEDMRVIIHLQDKSEEVRQITLSRSKLGGLSEKQMEAVHTATKGITNRLLPMTYLCSSGQCPQGSK